MASNPEPAGSTRWRGFLKAGVVAAVLSSAVCVLVYLVARALGVSLLVPVRPPEAGMQQVPLPAVVVSCVVPTVLATLAFAVLARLTRRPLEVLLGVGTLLWLASYVPVVLLPTDVPTRVVLGILHALAFLFILGPLVGIVKPPLPVGER